MMVQLPPNSLVQELKLNTPGLRLKYLRTLCRLTRAEVEKKHEIPEVTLKSWENGITAINTKSAKRCLDVYKKEGLIVSEEWLMEGIGLDPVQSTSVSHIFAQPTTDALPLENDEICMIRDANEFKEKYPNAVVMMVSGDEMRPFYKPGDYVGGRMRFGKEIEDVVNKDCIIYLKNKHHYFRRLLKNSSGGYNLSCLNPNETMPEPVLYNVEIEGAAPIIWHRWKDE